MWRPFLVAWGLGSWSGQAQFTNWLFNLEGEEGGHARATALNSSLEGLTVQL